MESLEIGYYGPPKGTRFAITDETTPAEAYSTKKQQWVVMWVWSPPGGVANRQTSRSMFHGSGQQQNKKIAPIK